MKKAIISILFFLPLVLSAQNSTTPETPYIEVTGSAEKSIVPNEIYIAINLTERYNGKNKVSIEKQEKKLKEALIDDGIYLANLTVADAAASYVKVRWGKKDVINEKEFILKTTSAEQIAKVFTILDDLDIQDASIARVDHSEMEDLKKEVKIEAIKMAKEKASYLLKAIDEKIGKPLVIYENGPVYTSNTRVDGLYVSNKTSSESKKNDLSVEFEKIIIRASIYVKYAIE